MVDHVVPALPGTFVVTVFLDMSPKGINYRLASYPVIAWRVLDTGSVPVVPGSLPAVYGLRYPDGKTVISGVTFEAEAKGEVIEALAAEWQAAKSRARVRSVK